MVVAWSRCADRDASGWVAQPGRRPDLIRPLANEFDVRRAIGQRGEPILIHATTSPNWTAELHRHLADRDGCMDCRLPEPMTGALLYATGPTLELAGAPREKGGELSNHVPSGCRSRSKTGTVLCRQLLGSSTTAPTW